MSKYRKYRNLILRPVILFIRLRYCLYNDEIVLYIYRSYNLGNTLNNSLRLKLSENSYISLVITTFNCFIRGLQLRQSCA